MALAPRMVGPKATKEGYETNPLCGLPPVEERVLPVGLSPSREALIRYIDKKWLNGTVLHYFFFDRDTDGRMVEFQDGSKEFVSWVGAQAQRQAVRDAFQTWKDLGIGLQFVEVNDRNEAELRIGFDKYDGSWSYVGRDNVDLAEAKRPNVQTMNFGWNLTTPYGRDTALHEIGHSMGFPHEHQNPRTGIVWNADAVYEWAARTQDWSRSETDHNIVRKIASSAVDGTAWDPNSIMHYYFEAGLIDSPEQYRNQDLIPDPGLSPADIEEATRFYPALAEQDDELKPFESKHLRLGAAEQVDFVIRPEISGKYVIQTFGDADTVMVLFEERDGEPRYLAGDDDSGTDLNAVLRQRLIQGRTYRLRLRLYWPSSSGSFALMMW